MFDYSEISIIQIQNVYLGVNGPTRSNYSELHAEMKLGNQLQGVLGMPHQQKLGVMPLSGMDSVLTPTCGTLPYPNLHNGLLPLGQLATYQYLLLQQQQQNLTRNILSLPNLANQGLEYRYVIDAFLIFFKFNYSEP